MKKGTWESSLADLQSVDSNRQNKAFEFFHEATKEPVDWAYEVWDVFMGLLKEGTIGRGRLPPRRYVAWPRVTPRTRCGKTLLRSWR